MKIHQYKEMMKYLTRPDVSNIPIPVPQAPAEPRELSNEEHAAILNERAQGYATGGRVGYADGTTFDYNALSNEGRVQAAQKRVMDYVKKFKKENGRLPSQQEVRYKGGFDFQTVKKAIQLKNIEVLPLNQTKGEFTKIPVHKDLKTLDQSKIIQDAFKSGEPPSLNDVKKVLKIKDPTIAANRITQLASVYSGESDVEGIKPKFKESAKTILKDNTYDSQIRTISEKAIAKSVGERRTPASIRTTTQRDFIPNIKGYSIDEPAGITSSVRNKTTPYGVFSQIIDTDINKGDKYAFDSIKSKKEVVLQNAIESGDKTEINKALKDYNKAVSKYENILNKDVKPGELKIKLFKASLDGPENTIKNFDNLPEKYQEAFTKNFNENGFSYEVPKKIKTIYQIGEDLKDPKIAEQVAKRAAQGQSRIYSFPANLSEAPILNRAGSIAKGYWNLTGGIYNPMLGAVLNSEQMQEAGLGQGEAATYGAIKGTLQDPGNFAMGLLKASPIGTTAKAIGQIMSGDEESLKKDILKSPKEKLMESVNTVLNDRTIDISEIPGIGHEWYADKMLSEKDKINNLIETEIRKKQIPMNPFPPVTDFGPVEGQQDYMTQEEKQQYKQNVLNKLLERDAKLKEKYYAEEKPTGVEFKTGGRVGYAEGSNDELEIPTLSNQETPMTGIYNAKSKRLESLSPYESYSEQEILGNIESKLPHLSIDENRSYEMPQYAPGHIIDKATDVMPNVLTTPKNEDGIISLATGGRASFQTGGSANFLKMLRNISDSVRELKNSTHMLGYTARSSGITKAAEEALTPYAGGFKGNKHETLIQKIETAKEHLPKEYHGVLDEMKAYADKHAYDAVDDMAKALDKTIDSNLKFENLSKKMFPMEDPLNDAFIIIDPEKGHSVGRYVQRHTVDQETGRGIIQTMDTWDPVNRRFLPEGEQKLIGVESIEKGKEGLN